MKIIENVTVFQCDHCGKKQFRKCDMTQHEKWCFKNENNKHKCFQYCKHLIRSKEFIEEGGYQMKTVFTCGVTKKNMFSYKAERRKISHYTPDAERMPLKCEFYEDRMDDVFI